MEMPLDFKERDERDYWTDILDYREDDKEWITWQTWNIQKLD